MGWELGKMSVIYRDASTFRKGMDIWHLICFYLVKCFIISFECYNGDIYPIPKFNIEAEVDVEILKSNNIKMHVSN